MHDAERWAPVPGYEGLYEVSDRGGMRSLPRKTAAGTRGGRTLRSRPTPTGYMLATLWKDGAGRTTYVHRLVLAAFVGPCPPGHETRHLNGDPGDNRLENLQYGTDAENGLDRIAHGTSTPGVHNPQALLTDDAVRQIRNRHAAGETQAALAGEYGVSDSCIGLVVNRARWRHIA